MRACRTPLAFTARLLPHGARRTAHRGNVPRSSVRTVVMASPSTTTLVTPNWVNENLADIHVVDASWHMPALKRSAVDEFKAKRIPGAKFFDIDGVSDAANPAPHMLPSTQGMRASLHALGLNDDKAVVLYDNDGMFSVARAWWMFRVFGRDNVFVLDGGAPAYEAAGFAMELDGDVAAVDASARACQDAMKGEKGRDFRGEREFLVKSMDDVIKNIDASTFQVVDARGQARFRGEAAEPRAGVRSGHIPGSRNVFFGDLLSSNKTFKTKDEIRAIFVSNGVNLSGDKPIVCSCGTGVTACILALALDTIGIPNVAVYDGSWSEYGADENAPIAVGEA